MFTSALPILPVVNLWKDLFRKEEWKVLMKISKFSRKSQTFVSNRGKKNK